MRKLSVFNFISLNGFYKDQHGDISWHKHGPEENEFAANSLQADNCLLFGRITYELMASYWPTPMAMENDPKVATGMNNAEKIVFSRSLKSVTWNKTRLISENIVDEIRKLKESDGKDFTILGSGSIVTQFAEHGLIDEYQFMIDPVALGAGTPIFNEINKQLNLKLTSIHSFKSGVVLLRYQPVN
ncbi:dihydrofolate reductase family protein [Solitalea lacus]|uniref:dihydrofolate reductase family protein n=1 Tax=Solitalea lacus TaxID=2911172 RepID=UPI001EDAB522|nr:dihydrofolate reductase family protein [Solitalea lacus]UKJ08373.1 dihydrofolate reductase family protein [Solitalea lacus]